MRANPPPASARAAHGRVRRRLWLISVLVLALFASACVPLPRQEPNDAQAQTQPPLSAYLDALDALPAGAMTAMRVELLVAYGRLLLLDAFGRDRDRRLLEARARLNQAKAVLDTNALPLALVDRGQVYLALGLSHEEYRPKGQSLAEFRREQAQALDWYRKAVPHLRDRRRWPALNTVYYNMAQCARRLGQTEQALGYAWEALRIGREYGLYQEQGTDWALVERLLRDTMPELPELAPVPEAARDHVVLASSWPLTVDLRVGVQYRIERYRGETHGLRVVLRGLERWRRSPTATGARLEIVERQLVARVETVPGGPQTHPQWTEIPRPVADGRPWIQLDQAGVRVDTGGEASAEAWVDALSVALEGVNETRTPHAQALRNAVIARAGAYLASRDLPRVWDELVPRWEGRALGHGLWYRLSDMAEGSGPTWHFARRGPCGISTIRAGACVELVERWDPFGLGEMGLEGPQRAGSVIGGGLVPSPSAGAGLATASLANGPQWARSLWLVTHPQTLIPHSLEVQALERDMAASGGGSLVRQSSRYLFETLPGFAL